MGRKRKFMMIFPLFLVVLIVFSTILSASAEIQNQAESDTLPPVLSEVATETEAGTDPQSNADGTADDGTQPESETASGAEESSSDESGAGQEGGAEENEDPQSGAGPSEPGESSVIDSDEEQGPVQGKISGIVWEDADEDGLMALEEERVGGIRLLLYSADHMAQYIDETVTNENGKYAFDSIDPGDYRVAVAEQTVGDKHYLPVEEQPGGDSKFDVKPDSDPVRSYTQSIPIEEESAITAVNAGLRLHTEIRPMSGTGLYNVYRNGVLSGNFDTLEQAVAACNTSEPFTIELLGNDTDMGAAPEIWSDRSIKLTSGAGGPYTITQTRSDRHIFVFGNNTTTLTLENITLQGTGLASGGEKNGGVRVGYQANLVVNAGTVIQKCYWDNGGGIAVVDGTVTVNGASILNNGAEYDGGGIYGSSNTTLTINSGMITENTAGDEGGGIYLSDNGNNLTVETANITNNHASAGGGIFARNSNVYLNAGSVAHNTAGGDGGGLRTTNTNIAIGTADISDNRAAYGAGISANSDSGSSYTVTLTAGTITRNTDSQRGGGVNIDKNMAFTMNGGEISHNRAALGGGIIASANSQVMIYGGTISGNTATGDGGGILAEGGCSVTLSGSSVSVTGNTAGSGGGVNAQGGLTVHYASVTNNKATVNGGGAFTNGITELNGAVFTGNEAGVDGGGIRGSGASVTVDGSDISGNKAAHGAGISLNGSSTVTMKNGSTITGNTAGKRGGGVNIDDSTVFTMQDGQISGNHAETGGGVIASLNSVFTMDTGEIAGNTASLHGGGFRIEMAQLLINGGMVQNNKVGSNGGGVYLWASGKLFMTGGAITDNTTVGDGGGIFTEDFAYENPLNSKYDNIDISGPAVVDRNQSGATQDAPSPGSALIRFDIGLLDNDEINYYPQQIAIIYDANGGNGGPVTKYYGYDSDVVLESPTNLELDFTPAAAEDKFIHWNTEPDGSGTSYAGDGTGIYYNLTEITTFYAIWGLKSGTIGGHVFLDEDKSGAYETGEGLADRTVMLYRKDATGTYVNTNITAKTDSEGWYQFTVETNTSYQVRFKVVDDDGVGEAGFIAKGTTDISSHVNQNGTSDEINVGYLTAAERERISNAGYAPPFPVDTRVYLDMMPWIALVLVSNILILGMFLVNRRIKLRK